MRLLGGPGPLPRPRCSTWFPAPSRRRTAATAPTTCRCSAWNAITSGPTSTSNRKWSRYAGSLPTTPSTRCGRSRSAASAWTATRTARRFLPRPAVAPADAGHEQRAARPGTRVVSDAALPEPAPLRAGGGHRPLSRPWDISNAPAQTPRAFHAWLTDPDGGSVPPENCRLIVDFATPSRCGASGRR